MDRFEEDPLEKNSLNAIPSSFVPTVGHLVSRYLAVTENWVYQQIVNLRAYRPFVLTSLLENREQFPFDPVFCYAQKFPGNHVWQIALRKLYEGVTGSRDRYYAEVVRSQQTQLLHAHFGIEGYRSLGIQRRFGLPLITTFYGFDATKLPTSLPRWRARYQHLFAAGSLFLAEGPHLAQTLVNLGCPPDKVRVQHLGVDLDRIKFVPRVRQDAEPARILMVARFREKKGIPYGIEAFAQAVRHNPAMELRIIGGAKDTEEQKLLDYCKEIARREGITHKVHFLGYVAYADYLDEMDSAHLFLAPSMHARDGDTEGGAPVTIIEASAAGLPVIATFHCDIPEVILNGQSGVLAPERDVPALTQAILDLAASPGAWARMGESGRRHIEREFNIAVQIPRLEALYDQVIGRTPDPNTSVNVVAPLQSGSVHL